MKELAESVAENSDFENAEALLERWKGRPERVAEDIFQARNMETGEMEDLEFFRPYQPRLVHAYFYGDEEIINVYKGRRIGVSFTFIVCVILEALFKPDTFYPIVSKTKSQSKARIKDAKELIKNAKVDFDLETDNKDEIVLSNGSRLKAYTGDPDSGRGDDSAKTVFVDEMAFLEDQQETMQTFMPFISLGSAKMLQVSTPKMSNDLFLDNHERGSPSGENGIISIKQPSFKNADDIDPEVPLTDQDVEPVRPDMNINTVETERAQDPQGFAQEYLCRPISDEYRFLSAAGIDAAMSRGEEPEYAWGPYTTPQHGGKNVMGVDIGTDSDMTAITVFEHTKNHRYLRYHEIVTEAKLRESGIANPDRANPSDVASRIEDIANQMQVSGVTLDKTGSGRGFQSEVNRKLGKRAHGFNFTDKEAVQTSMEDFNYYLHNDQMSLIEDETLEKQLKAIVKEQSHEYQTPKFSGKEHAPNRKDDLAISAVLAAFPPNQNTDKSTKMHQKPPESARSGSFSANQGMKARKGSGAGDDSGVQVSFGSNSVSRGRRGRNSYNTRHSR
jgi:hypothetical protein